MQTHQARRKHFRMNSVVATRTCSKLCCNMVWHTTNACLQRASIVNVLHGNFCNFHFCFSRNNISQIQWLAFRLHQKIDVVYMHTVHIFPTRRIGAKSARKVRAHFHNEHPLRVGNDSFYFVGCCACVKRQTHPTINGFCTRNCKYSRLLTCQDRSKAAKVGGHKINIGTTIAQKSFGGPKKPTL